MKLIVGLGNPGKRYNLTRHNVGFMVVEELARLNGLRFSPNQRFKALTAKGVIEGEDFYLAKPQEFMNLSGYSVRAIVNWFKIDLNLILLVVDDIMLPFGDIRIRARGSDAGHKGLSSVIDCLGTSKFPRMRIGIMGRNDIEDFSIYVLSRFTKKEQEALPDILKRATSACECWAFEGISVAMNRYNRKVVRG